MHTDVMMATVKEPAIDDGAAAVSNEEPARTPAATRQDFERVYRKHGPGLFRAIYPGCCFAWGPALTSE